MSRYSRVVAVLVAAGLTACAEATRPTIRSADLDIVVPTHPRLLAGVPQFDCTPLLDPTMDNSGCPTTTSTSGTSSSSGTQTPPDGLPSGYDWNTFLTVSADAGFTAEGAYGQSVVNFTATNATADVKLTLSSGGSSIGTNAGHAETSSVFPSTTGITAQTTIASSTTCGLSAASHADGSSWDSFLLNFNILSWGKKSDSNDKTSTQATCQNTNTGGSGGDGGTTYYTCYYIVYTDSITGAVLGVTPLGCYAT